MDERCSPEKEQRKAAGLGQNGDVAARAAMVAPAPVVSRLRRVSYGAWSSAAVSTTSSAASVASGDDRRGWQELGRWGVRWGELEALGWVLPCEN